MSLNHYQYHFVQRFDISLSSYDNFLKSKLLYAFKSTKTHQWYWVWVEEYAYDFYAVKFHLKAHRDSDHKYSLMSGLYEARPVINTCIMIMLEIAKKNPKASFGFIGANMPDESTVFTKRFRVYSIMMATYFDEIVFKHYVLFEKSAYLLIRKSVLDLYPNLVSELNNKFRQLYPYFE